MEKVEHMHMVRGPYQTEICQPLDPNCSYALAVDDEFFSSDEPQPPKKNISKKQLKKI
jgi:hypothetical protein